MRSNGSNNHQANYPRSASNSYSVVRFALFESGRWHDRHTRPLVVNTFTTRMVDELRDTTSPDGKVNSRSLAGLANNILTLKSEVDSVHDRINISNGWDEKRLSFMLELEVQENYGTRSYLYVTGYSDRLDVSLQSSSINPDTEFYINNIFELGGTETIRLPRNFQIINAHALSDGGLDSDNAHMIRPSDVLHRLGLKDEPRFSSYRDDTNNVSQNQLSTSSRDNTISSRYLANTLNAMQVASRYEEPTNAFYGDDDVYSTRGRSSNNGSNSVYTDAAALVKEESITSNAFLYDLKSNCDYQKHGSFTYGNLRKLVPEIDRVADLYLIKNDPRKRDRRVGDMDGQEWDGHTDTAIAATIIAQAFPTIAFNNLITSIDITFTNEGHRSGAIDYTPGEAVVFFTDRLSADKERDLVLNFADTCITEVLNGLTENGLLDIYLQVNMNIQGDIFINIAFNGGLVEEFNTATFCDSLTTPHITPSARINDDLAEGIKFIHGELRRY